MRRGRHVQHVVAAAGELGEREVAGDDRRLGLGRTTGDAELGRPLPFVHVPTGDQIRILGVLRDDRARERRAYSNARRITFASATQSPSSVKTRTPRSYSSPSGASSCPARPWVMHPATVTRHDTWRPFSSTAATTLASSSGGVVFGIATTAVKPPSAAARAGLDRLGLLAARLAEVHLDVDQAGRDHAALGVEHRAHRERRAGPDLGDHAVAHQHVGHALTGLVEHASAADDQRVRQPVLPIR